MKPIITWAILANSTQAHVVENSGPGRGFAAIPGRTFRAADPMSYSDQPGVTHSPAGSARSAMDKNSPKRLAESLFARQLAEALERDHAKGRFARLILVAAPHMLGELRAAMPQALVDLIAGEVDKDLTQVPVRELPERLGHVFVA
ncbi:MAG: hypothetical protein GKR99_03415 [Rhodobacteraceae bacterium]|nr:hypothetical protein [Paracoccaceae bacterium]